MSHIFRPQYFLYFLGYCPWCLCGVWREGKSQDVGDADGRRGMEGKTGATSSGRGMGGKVWDTAGKGWREAMGKEGVGQAGETQKVKAGTGEELNLVFYIPTACCGGT